MRKVFISPAGLFIVMLYFLITGITALINPPTINNEEKVTIIINDHLRKREIFSPLMIPGILNVSKRISDIRKNRKPYTMNASQKPPRILSTSEITEECFDSRILAAINIPARRKKIIE